MGKVKRTVCFLSLRTKNVLNNAASKFFGIYVQCHRGYNTLAMMMTKKPVINFRQKTLLGLLNTFHGRLPRIDFQKYLFLYTQEFEQEPSFEFVPYKFGSFSFQSYADKRRLLEIGALEESDDWRLSKDFRTRDLFDQQSFDLFYKKYSALKGDRLVQDIYRRYPYYAINSEIAPRLMTDREIAAIAAERPNDTSPVLFYHRL